MQTPENFGRYQLLRLLGEGGMAQVYLATVAVAQGLRKQVVIKKIRPEFAGDPEFTAMFVEEAKIALGLNHANLVQVFDFGEVRGQLFLAMEWVDGVDLMKLIQQLSQTGAHMPAVIAAYIAHQVAAALSYAHQKTDDYGRPLAISHRDVSPHNIMLSHAGTVKLLDFGIAKQARENIVQANTGGEHPAIHGKLAYMSPEQARGQALDARTDLYSLGVVLYELLSGTLVHRQHGLTQTLEMVRSGTLAPIGEVAPHTPPALQEVVERALQRDPTQRFATAREMQARLAGYLHRADPVVDDEVLSNFLHQHLSPAPIPTRAPTADATAVVVARPDIKPPPNPEAANMEVTVVRAGLAPQLQTKDPPDHRKLGRLVTHLAETRGAIVVGCDRRDITLVFGALGDGQNPEQRALAASLALCEAVGMVGHGLGLGIAMANMHAHVSHGQPGGLRVQLPVASEQALAQLAHAGLDGPIWVCGDLPHKLADLWEFDHNAPPPLELANTPFLGGAALLGPLKERSQQPHTSRLIGRELELRGLRTCLAEALRTGRPRAALVVGQPGHGKHALIRTFLKGLPNGALTVVRVVGQWRRRNVSLGTLLDALRQLLTLPPAPDQTCIDNHLASDIPEPNRRREFAAALHQALVHHDHTKKTLVPSQRPWQRREQLWQLISEVVLARATSRPVLLVVENLHLIDDHSFQRLRSWLEHRLDPRSRSYAQLSGAPIVCLLSSRPGDREQLLRKNPGLQLVNVRELSPAHAYEMVTQRFVEPQRAHELARAVVDHTGGNPMFIEETLADLLRRKVVGLDPDHKRLHLHTRNPTLTLPPTVEAALKARVDALPAGVREVLLAASVLGVRFRVDELGHLVGRDCNPALAELEQLGLLHRPSQPAAPQRLQFASRSLHDVCKTSLPRNSAGPLHRAAASLKLARPDYTPGRDDGPIADHLAQAQAFAEAIDPALRAAAHARAAASSVEAYYFLSLALRALAPTDPRRVLCLLQRDDVLRTWGRLRAQGANLRQISEAVQELKLTGQPTEALEVTALLRLLRFYLECERVTPAQQLLPRVEAALEQLRATGKYVVDTPNYHDNSGLDPLLASLHLAELKARLMRGRGEFAAALQQVEEHLPRCPATEAGNHRRARLELVAARVLCDRTDYQPAIERMHRALALARQLEYRRLEAEVLAALGEATARNTRYQEAISWFRKSLAIDRDLGDRFATGTKLANLGITYTAIGLYDRALRYLRKALELHEGLGQGVLRDEVLINLGVVLAALGQRAQARAYLTEAIGNTQKHGDVRAELRARSRLVLLAVADVLAGEPREPDNEIIAAAQKLLDDAHGQQQRSPATRVLHALSLLADYRGDLAKALDYERRAVKLVERGAAALDGVLSLHHLGVLLDKHGSSTEGAKYRQRAEHITQARLEDLRDATLRSSYLAQPDVQRILGHRLAAKK